EAGHDPLAAGVDDLLAGERRLAHRLDAAAANAEVGDLPGAAAAVEDGAAGDDDVEGLRHTGESTTARSTGTPGSGAGVDAAARGSACGRSCVRPPVRATAACRTASTGPATRRTSSWRRWPAVP